jgi:hypothetical protein
MGAPNHAVRHVSVAGQCIVTGASAVLAGYSLFVNTSLVQDHVYTKQRAKVHVGCVTAYLITMLYQLQTLHNVQMIKHGNIFNCYVSLR